MSVTAKNDIPSPREGGSLTEQVEALLKEDDDYPGAEQRLSVFAGDIRPPDQDPETRYRKTLEGAGFELSQAERPSIRRVDGTSESVHLPPRSKFDVRARRPGFNTSAIYKKRREKLKRAAERDARVAAISAAKVVIADAVVELALEIGVSVETLLVARGFVKRALNGKILELVERYQEQLGKIGASRAVREALSDLQGREFTRSRFNDAVKAATEIQAAEAA